DVGGRLVAADEDEQALHEQLVVAQAGAVDLGVHEDADQVVTRMGVSIGDDGALIGDVVGEGGGGAQHAGGIGGAGAEDHRPPPGPPAGGGGGRRARARP